MVIVVSDPEINLLYLYSEADQPFTTKGKVLKLITILDWLSKRVIG